MQESAGKRLALLLSHCVPEKNLMQGKGNGSIEYLRRTREGLKP